MHIVEAFCGGDPLTRYDIVDLLEKTKNIGYNISLDTLGSNLIKNIINNKGNIIYKRIEPKIISKYIDTIGIPIDGSSNNIINIFRQSNTDIVKEQQLICKELSKYCKNICINTVVHKGNIDDALELTKLVNNLDFINKWQLFKYIPTGKFGTKNKEIYDITTEQFNKFKDIVKSNYISNDKLQFKDENVRSKAYMMVDNSGNAWIPCYNNNKTNNERNIIGNIKNKNDWENIVYYLDTNKERRCIYE